MIRQVATALALLAGCAAGGTALAFDTGPHATLTEQAMAQAGYSRPAADAVQVENWLTDYYTSSPTFAGDRCALEKLHFDDVFTDADVDAYWKTLLRNTIAAARQAKADNDIVRFYVVLGVSLHVVQDFYAHSNWVESSGFGGSGFDTTTYFQWKRAPWPRTGALHTGWYPNCLNIPQDGHEPHGGYASGMNHDSVVRPNFNRAYVYGLAASTEWLNEVAQALDGAPGDPTFLSRAMNYRPSPDDAVALARDQDASLYLSEWIQNPTNVASLDGHWNGNHSGYIAAFTPYALSWTSRSDSTYVRAFKSGGVYEVLSQGLYAPYAGPDPQVSVAPLSGTVVDMRVANACAIHGLQTSYFGQLVAMAGAPLTAYPIRDAAQIHLSCPATPWEYLLLAPPSVSDVSFQYSFFDEVGVPSPGQNAVRINGDATGFRFVCAMPPASSGCTMAGGGPMPSRFAGSGSVFNRVASISGVSVQLRPASPWAP